MEGCPYDQEGVITKPGWVEFCGKLLVSGKEDALLDLMSHLEANMHCLKEGWDEDDTLAQHEDHGKLTASETLLLDGLFTTLDANHSNTIDREELMACHGGDADGFLKLLDFDHDNQVSKEEWP